MEYYPDSILPLSLPVCFYYKVVAGFSCIRNKEGVSKIIETLFIFIHNKARLEVIYFKNAIFDAVLLHEYFEKGFFGF